ncbi:hypothetical protein F5Y05DRAFT_406942 [Hypoxylon sp. FL0543]|nr:hypothetical protein F5Y05DRAFT_406942 [Hypoxylon sp. FL0543]
MVSKSYIRILAVLASVSAVAARRLTNLHRPYLAPSVARATGTGPKGFLTVDDKAHDGIQLHGTFADVAGGTFSACLADTTASVTDCQAVINDIRANNGTINVAGGFCLNWWEGGCLGRVCGGKSQETYEADSQFVADTITNSLLNTCVGHGKSGAAADCADVSSRACVDHHTLVALLFTTQCVRGRSTRMVRSSL